MPRFYSLLSSSPPPLPPAPLLLDADAIYPNCYLEWRSGHFGKPVHGSTKAARPIVVASVALLLLAAAAVAMLVSFAVGMGLIQFSIPGETVGSAGIPLSIPYRGYWG